MTQTEHSWNMGMRHILKGVDYMGSRLRHYAKKIAQLRHYAKKIAQLRHYAKKIDELRHRQ
jgi:hypothetical protein